MEQFSSSKYKWIVAAAGLIVVAFMVWYFHTIVFYILGAAAVSLLGRPIVKLLERVEVRKRRIPRWLSATITLLLLLSLFAYLCLSLIPTLTNGATFLSTLDTAHIDAAIANIDNWLATKFQNTSYSVRGLVEENITPFFSKGFMKNIFAGITTVIVEASAAVFSISFIAFFFLKDEKLFNSGVMMLFPKKYEQNIDHAINSSINLLGRYFIGIFLESLIKFVVVLLSLWALNMDFSTAAIIGVVTAVLNVIPYIGPIIGGLFAVMIAAVSTTSPEMMGDTIFNIAIVLTVFQLLDNMVLQPYIYSSSVKAHPLEIFIVTLMAGYVSGVLGMLLAIPSYTVLRVFAKEFFANLRVVKKLTENL